MIPMSLTGVTGQKGSVKMTNDDVDRLRGSAYRFRTMADNGDDPHLKVALIELAEDFEREAAGLERQDDGAGGPEPVTVRSDLGLSGRAWPSDREAVCFDQVEVTEPDLSS
jgi:hypothetical protein